MVAAFGCDDGNSFNPDSSTQPGVVDEASLLEPISGMEEDAPLEEDGLVQAVPLDGSSAALSFAGGIPMGLSAQPNGLFGSLYNGSLRNIHPQYLRSNLAEIKARGGRILLNMSGGQRLYTNRDGTFNLSKWKDQIDRYRNVDFRSYINDGTVIGHYMIDEPHHASKWGGRPISGTTLEEMARYSKEKYPGLPTIARTYPPYLERWGPYRHLDAAWAAYVYRFGNVHNFIDEHIASAKKQGLGLVVGLNVLKGGPNKRQMTASQVREWGSALLNSSYPCAFVSWKYEGDYVDNSGIRDAMRYLRNKAENRSTRRCTGS
jgi:hypothetical protein